MTTVSVSDQALTSSEPAASASPFKGHRYRPKLSRRQTSNSPVVVRIGGEPSQELVPDVTAGRRPAEIKDLYASGE
jgi:hypothetical protein